MRIQGWMQHTKRCSPCGQTSDPEIAALDDSRFGHVDVLKAAAAFRNGLLSVIEPFYESATKLLYFSKRMRLAASIF